MRGAALAALLLAAGCDAPKPPDVPVARPAPPVLGTPLAEIDFLPTLKASGARFVVISVFAADCGPCVTESLQLMDRRDAWKKEGVEILGLGMGDSPEDVRRFYTQTGDRAAFPLYFAPWFSEKHEVEATPTLFIYSAAGEKLFRADGTEAEDLPKLADEKLRPLLAAKPS